jgi:predicted nucleic acid-binding protein
MEYEDVMSRDDMFEGSPVGRTDRMTLFRAFLSACRWTQVYYLWRPNLPDEDDNHVFELALAGGAAVLVTNNVRDFRSSELKFPEIRVLRPHEFVKGKN